MSSWQVFTSRNSGLPADRVTAIAEDASGALWFGTYGGGLARLDAGGRTWTVWRIVQTNDRLELSDPAPTPEGGRCYRVVSH